MIEIKNFSKKYSDTTVYENFNLTVEEGKVTCILGESGSGKTTLLNAVAGLINYDGRISDIKCSYVFQEPRLVPNLTVKGNLKLICPDENKISEMLEMVSLTEKSDCYPVKLSGGQAQRVSLARAFLYGGELILMDEPFSSLDLKLKLQMMQLFSALLKKYGKSALFVTHDVDEALKLADRIVVIEHGKIIYDKIPSDLSVRTEKDEEQLRRELISVLT